MYRLPGQFLEERFEEVSIVLIAVELARWDKSAADKDEAHI